jgi:biopolymer transport protein ExbD
MKRLPLVVLVVLVSVTGVLPVTHVLDHLALTAAVEAQQDPAKITVYITKTGEKYHRDGCSSLRRSRFAVSLKEAVARGYGTCKNCKPPTIR